MVEQKWRWITINIPMEEREEALYYFRKHNVNFSMWGRKKIKKQIIKWKKQDKIIKEAMREKSLEE